MSFDPDPALVFAKPDVAGARTHVLAIGIGTYPYLNGGTEALAAYHLKLGQLSSPPLSALEVADWFSKEFVCVDKPLASVALVMSTIDTAPLTWNGKKMPSGTLVEVQYAVKAWIKRANNPEDRIILYFCGHGFATGAQNFCLLRDFGDDDQRPMANAINYQEFAAALETRIASDQLFIFDSCREDDPLVSGNPNGGDPIVHVLPNGRPGLDPVQQCVIFAASRDMKSGGLANRPSLCAQAVVRSFAGAASVADENGVHYVTTTRLLEALLTFQQQGPEAERVAQTPRPDMTRCALMNFRRFAAAPKIPVFVRRKNRAPFAAARIEAHRQNQITELAAAFSGAEVEVLLAQGEYQIEAWLNDKKCPSEQALVAPVRTIVPIGDPP